MCTHDGVIVHWHWYACRQVRDRRRVHRAPPTARKHLFLHAWFSRKKKRGKLELLLLREPMTKEKVKKCVMQPWNQVRWDLECILCANSQVNIIKERSARYVHYYYCYYYLEAATSSRRLSFSATADLFREKTNNKIALKEKEIDVRRMEVELATTPTYHSS